MLKAENEEFQDTCRAHLGFVSSLHYKDWALKRSSKLAELDDISRDLTDHYSVLFKSKKWSGITNKASAFKALTSTSSSTREKRSSTQTSPSSPKQQPSNDQPTHRYSSFEEWWKNQRCTIPGCGGKHPTRYHHNLGELERRTRKDSGQRQPQQKPTSFKQSHRSPRFKSDSDKNKFYKSVHKAAVEHLVEEDHDLVANLAGGDSDNGEFEDALQSEFEIECADKAWAAICSLNSWRDEPYDDWA